MAARGGAVDVRVDGDQLRRVRAELNRLGDKELKKALFAGLNRATKPMREAALREAPLRLPRRGGLGDRVARTTKLGTSTSRGGVAIFGRNRSQARLMDQGFVRHPVFGNREVWVTQQVEAGYFTVPASRAAPRARGALVVAMKRIERELEGR